jgi:hypothetical protein
VLGRRDHAPSGNALREAGWPLRERAGRENLASHSAKSHRRTNIWNDYRIYHIDNITRNVVCVVDSSSLNLQSAQPSGSSLRAELERLTP